jgi:type III pantothenate kinase
MPIFKTAPVGAKSVIFWCIISNAANGGGIFINLNLSTTCAKTRYRVVTQRSQKGHCYDRRCNQPDIAGFQIMLLLDTFLRYRYLRSRVDTVIDIGNTRVKIGSFEKGKLVNIASFETEPVRNFYTHLTMPSLGNCILSSVTDVPDHVQSYIRGKSKLFIQLDPKTPLPIKNKYKSPDTLGNDRLALAAGAAYLYPEKACLVISAGTCITYNMVDKKGHFTGGAISPGLQMRFRSMHEFTAKLPLLTPPENVKATGETTAEAMQSGVVQGIAGEIERFAALAKQQYADICIVLSGGDSQYLAEQLDTEADVVPDLALFGLYEILKFNEKKAA